MKDNYFTTTKTGTYRINHITGSLNVIVLRPQSRSLAAFNFIEKDNEVVFQDTNGEVVPLDKVVIETEEVTFNIKSLPKNKLSEIMCTPLYETKNFYVVKR